MAWTSLANRIKADGLPLVLAGPILRRTGNRSVTILLANVSRALSIYDDSSLLLETLTQKQKTPTRPILHVAVSASHLSSESPLNSGTLYRNDVDFGSVPY